MNIEKFNQASLNEFIESDLEGSFYVGHASVLFRINKKLFLIDGVNKNSLFENSWVFFPELIFDNLFYSLDGVFVSHCHDDHYDIDFLRKLRKNTPIYITKGRIGLDELIADPFLNSVEIEPMKMVAFDGFEVLAIPSDHNNFDSSFIIKNSSFSIYQGNDNFIPRDVIKKAFSITGSVSHVYIPFSYVWWYPFCLLSMPQKQKEQEVKRLSEKNMKIGLYIAEELDADIIIPSAGNLIFHDSSADHINRMIASPFDFLNFLESQNNPLAKKTFTLFSGDSILNEKEKINVYSSNISKEDYYHEMKTFLQEMEQQRITYKYDVKNTDPEKINLRQKKTINIKTDLFFKSRESDTTLIKFDCKIKKFIATKNIDSLEYISFDIEDALLERWIQGDVTLETVLNSQRLLINRIPERFDEETWKLIRTLL
jgi:UDP-MurNAc hydroxylase